MNALDLGLAIQNREFGFQIRRLDIHHQAPFKSRTKALHQTRRLLGRRVAGQHNLLLVIVEFIERMEELFLRALFAGQDLHVVHQQHVGGAIVLMEERHAVGSDALDELIHEALGGGVYHSRFAEAIQQRPADRVQQVCLAYAGASIDKKRVIAAGRLFSHGSGGRMGELVGAAHDEVGKVIALVELGVGAEEGIAHRSVRIARLVDGSRLNGAAFTAGDDKFQLREAQLQIARGGENLGAEFALDPLFGLAIGHGDNESGAFFTAIAGLREPALKAFPREPRTEPLFDLLPSVHK